MTEQEARDLVGATIGELIGLAPELKLLEYKKDLEKARDIIEGLEGGYWGKIFPPCIWKHNHGEGICPEGLYPGNEVGLVITTQNLGNEFRRGEELKKPYEIKLVKDMPMSIQMDGPTTVFTHGPDCHHPYVNQDFKSYNNPPPLPCKCCSGDKKE